MNKIASTGAREPEGYRHSHGGEVEEKFGQDESKSSRFANFANAANIVAGQSINPIIPDFNLHYLKETVISTYGYALLAASGAVIAFEQLPTNEDWRVRAGTQTLIDTGDSLEVAKTVFNITMKIELGSCAVIMAALYSGNSLIKASRSRFSQWREGGLERAKYRQEVKLDRDKEKVEEKNTKRIERGKEPNKLNKRERTEKDSELVKKAKEAATDITISLGIGAAITTMLRGVSGRDRTVLRSGITAATYSTFLAVFSGALGYIVASGKEINFEVPVINKTVDVSNILVDYGTDSKWILTALVLAYTPSTLKKLWHRTGRREGDFQNWLAQQEESRINTAIDYKK